MTAKKHRRAGNQAAESRGADTGNDTPPARLHIPDTLVRWSPPDPLPTDAIAAAMAACFIGDVAVPDLIRRIEALA